MKTSDYKSMDSTQRTNWKKMRRQVMYDLAEQSKVKNWQTEHKGYGVPMEKKDEKRQSTITSGIDSSGYDPKESRRQP